MIKRAIKKTIRAINPAWEKNIQEYQLFRHYKRDKGVFQWRMGARCPEKMVEGNGAVIGNKLYLFGGYATIDRVLNLGNVYDLKKNKWADRFATPNEMAQTHVGVATDKKRTIYLAGGQVGPHCSPCTGKCFVFDTQTKSFTEFVPLPEARYLSVMQYWNGRLHVIGGSLPDRFTGATNHWSIGVKGGRATEESWQEEVPIPRGGIHRGSVIIDNTLYVIGGSEGDVKPIPGDPEYKCDWNSPMEDVHGESYKLEAGLSEWKRIADMPLKLAHTDTTVVGYGHQILVFGGTERRDRCTISVWRYDIAADRWEKIGQLPYHMKSSFALYFEGRFILATGQRARAVNNYRPTDEGSRSVWIADDPFK